MNTFIEVRGKKLWVEQEGSGEPLMLLAGGPAAAHRIFKPYFSALAARFKIIYYDYYGRGQSEKPSNYQDISLASDVQDLEDPCGQALGARTRSTSTDSPMEVWSPRDTPWRTVST